MEQLQNIISTVQGYVWGLPLLVLLVGTGIFLTVRLKLVQWRGFKHSFELISGKYDKPEHKGEISHFQALSAALSATIGTGNITGVATAIAVGGPGALFWMWVTAVFGMAVKFTSCTLAIIYRKIDPDGSRNRHDHGWRWLDNDWVNFLSSAAGAAAAACLFALLAG